MLYAGVIQGYPDIDLAEGQNLQFEGFQKIIGIGAFKTKFLKVKNAATFRLKDHMGQFGQFGLNGFKQGQTHFSQLHISR